GLALYAQWTPNTNTVTFDANTGTGTMASESVTSGVATALTTDTFTKTGYSFKGWNTKADGTGTSYADGALITLTGGLALYAQWSGISIRVVFNGLGGNVIGRSAENWTFGSSSPPALSNASRDGYVFGGWSLIAGSSTAVQGGKWQPDGLVASVALYAIWTSSQVAVVFNSMGGSLSPAQMNYVVGGGSLTLPSAGTKSGAKFLGWSSSCTQSGQGSFIAQVGDSYVPPISCSSPITFSAMWSSGDVNDTLNFANADGSSSSVPNLVANDAATVNLPSGLTLHAPTGASSFSGWASSEGATSATYSGNAVISISSLVSSPGGSATLYAVWQSDSAPTMNTTGLPTSFAYGTQSTLPFTWLPGSGVSTMSVSMSGTGLSATSASCTTSSTACSLTSSDGSYISYVGGPGANFSPAHLTISSLTPPGTYTFLIQVANDAGSSSQSYTFTVASPNAPTDVVAATDLTRAQAVNLTWNPPAQGSVLSYDIQIYDVSTGASTYSTITGLTPAQVGCTSASSGCALNIGPSNYDRTGGLVAGSGLAGGQTFDFVVIAIFDNHGTESSATSNYTLPTSVAPSDSTKGSTSLSSSTTSTSTSSAAVGGTTINVDATAKGQGSVSVAVYPGSPTTGTYSMPSSSFSFDVAVSPSSSFSAVSFVVCGMPNGTLYWYNSLNNTRTLVTPAPVATGTAGCYEVDLSATSVPSISNQTLYGSIFFANATSSTSSSGGGGGGGGSTTTSSGGGGSTSSTTAPDAPSSVSAVPGDTLVTVTWVAPTSSAGSSAVTGYTVTSLPGGFTCTVNDPSSTSCVVPGLTNGTPYTFTVVANSSSGSSASGGPSNSAVPFGLPGPASDPSGAPGSGTGSVTVSWSLSTDPNGSPITGYRVSSQPGGLSCTAGPQDTSCVVNGLVSGTPYLFSIVAVNAAGASSPVTTTPVVVGASSKLVAEPSYKVKHLSLVVFPFAVAKSALTPSMDRQLNGFAKKVKALGVTLILSVGFTDSQGNPAYNVALGRARAMAVANYLRATLKKLGVKRPLHIVIRTRGESAPVGSNASAVGRAENRRVTITVEF
ncbi:MAG TPA: fibronectin type III domain-containing protein, partial [Acidimicrobiales bacterium]|nr:fibronectin type III domain-containing protein [Acidimicrobiales bacterium]